MRRVLLMPCLVVGLLGGCSGLDDNVKDSAETVLTLRSGTMSDLRQRVGQGPFRTYEIPPDEMLEILEEAVGEARGRGDRPIRAVFVSENRRQVVAKEREGEHRDDDGYSKPFVTAMVATVYPIRERPEASRVEIHAIRSGPFHGGRVRWERDMPTWIDRAIQKRRSAAAAPLAPIPTEAEPGLKPIP